MVLEATDDAPTRTSAARSRPGWLIPTLIDERGRFERELRTVEYVGDARRRIYRYLSEQVERFGIPVRAFQGVAAVLRIEPNDARPWVPGLVICAGCEQQRSPLRSQYSGWRGFRRGCARPRPGEEFRQDDLAHGLPFGGGALADDIAQVVSDHVVEVGDDADGVFHGPRHTSPRSL